MPTFRFSRSAQPARTRAAAALAILVLVAGACGGSSSDGEDASAEPTAADTAIDDADAEPTPIPSPTPAGDVDNTDLNVKPLVTVPEGDAPTELEIDDIVVGDGTVAAAGDTVVANYVGVAYSTGLQFDASWDRGTLFDFELGAGRVIDGWDQGIEGMAVGGRRELLIPPDLAYGETGSGSGAIGENDPLVFVVDLVAVIPAGAEKPEITVPDEPATELLVTDLVDGTGTAVSAGDVLHVHFVGAAQSSGEVFDSSWDRGTASVFSFVLGTGFVHAGLDTGLAGMQVGGRREIIVPPDLAYGEVSAGNGVIAAGETLVFVIDLLGVTPGDELPSGIVEIDESGDTTDTGDTIDDGVDEEDPAADPDAAEDDAAEDDGE